MKDVLAERIILFLTLSTVNMEKVDEILQLDFAFLIILYLKGFNKADTLPKVGPKYLNNQQQVSN